VSATGDDTSETLVGYSVRIKAHYAKYIKLMWHGGVRANAGPPSEAGTPPGGKKVVPAGSQRGAARDMLYLGKNIRELFPQKENFMLKLLWKPISYLSKFDTSPRASP